jgi:acetate---CoA ligase (ADP-forming)
LEQGNPARQVGVVEVPKVQLKFLSLLPHEKSSKMINEQLINPKSIVVVGASNDITKPGGKILKNIIDGGFKGKIYVNNPKEDEVQGIRSYRDLTTLPETDLAVIAIAAKHTLLTVEYLVRHNSTRAFIIISAGFSEESAEGKEIEQKIVALVNEVDGALVGPNCTGIITQNHKSVFTLPIPEFNARGCDFISSSGATAVFIMESGIQKGLTFANVIAVGNSAQMGVEDVLKYLDETYEPGVSAPVKLLYIENVRKPQMLLKHASSLVRKGCRIAAVKAGTSSAGQRAASSHTGALANPDVPVDALFRKAGIVRCIGRDELTTVASVLLHPVMKGKRIAIITHAGGPAVMLTDTLSNNGMDVPHIQGEAANELLTHLYGGSSVANPIDFLATGTAQQLGIIIDFVEKRFDEIDAMVVIFGTPGLNPVFDAYEVLRDRMKSSSKPIFSVLPSTLVAAEEVKAFLKDGGINFPDEVLLGNALCKVAKTPAPAAAKACLADVDVAMIRSIIDFADDGYLDPASVQGLLDAVGIDRAGEAVVRSVEEAKEKAARLGYPLVMKVVGPVHKSDVGGVVLNVRNEATVEKEFRRMITIPETTAILMQPMLSGTELFAGATKEGDFGHMIMLGMGGIFIEVLKDVQAALVPVDKNEIRAMVKNLRSYPLFEGVRGQEGVNLDAFCDTVYRLSALLFHAPEIAELDLNPLLGNKNSVKAVDARINIKK